MLPIVCCDQMSVSGNISERAIVASGAHTTLSRRPRPSPTLKHSSRDGQQRQLGKLAARDYYTKGK